MQAELVRRIVAAAWRARRADRLETALLGRHLAHAGVTSAPGGMPADVPAPRSRDDATGRQAALGAGLMRDGHGPRVLETLVRYRGAVLAELFRSLGALKVLQAEARAPAALAAVAPAALTSPARRPDRARGEDAAVGF